MKELTFSYRKTKRSTWGFVLGSLLMVVLLTARCSQRLTTYASLDPQTTYVGIQACQPCHQKITQSYLETGMGKSLYRPSAQNIIEEIGKIVYDPSTDFYYQSIWEGNEMFIREFRIAGVDTSHQRKEKVDYIVGSGHQTRSYLLQRNGYLFEFPITWYVNKGIWDLSPGYEGNNSRFDREIGLECLACHTGYVEQEAETKNRYRYISEGIDCEKCHGPGAEHIKRIQEGQLIDVGVEVDYSIVNPAKLPVDKQFDICQQCHLQGINVLEEQNIITDFRPAMRLRDLGSIFLAVDPDQSAFGIASHAERLKRSDCFLQSEGKLNCTTCHDPHKSVNRTDKEVFIRQCQSCHQDGKEVLCSESLETQSQMEGNCISCHMPKGGTSDIPHVSFHDHYIRVVEQDSAEVQVEPIAAYIDLICGNEAAPQKETYGKAWLSFYELQENDPYYLRMADSLLPSHALYERARIAFYKGDVSTALQRIDEAISSDSTDIYAQFFKGKVLESLGQHTRAYDLFVNLYRRQPKLWEAGLKAGVNLLISKQGQMAALDEGEQIFQALVEEKPFDVRGLSNLAFVYLNKREIRKAERLLVKALRLNPDHARALENMIYLQVLNQNRLQAQLYLDRFATKHPDNPQLTKLQQLVQI
ncbi:MAG: multiheme c-type cytochrome [Bacteroidota bacterium]